MVVVWLCIFASILTVAPSAPISEDGEQETAFARDDSSQMDHVRGTRLSSNVYAATPCAAAAAANIPVPRSSETIYYVPAEARHYAPSTYYVSSGYGNSGHAHSGYGHSGYPNYGHANTGYANQGYGNAGYGNAGYGNAGYENSGYSNTGYAGHAYNAYRAEDLYRDSSELLGFSDVNFVEQVPEGRFTYRTAPATYASIGAPAASVYGVFPNSNNGPCNIPLLFSCSPSVVAGHMAKPETQVYGNTASISPGYVSHSNGYRDVDDQYPQGIHPNQEQITYDKITPVKTVAHSNEKLT